MPYNYYNKYKITFATKTSKIAYLYLQEYLLSQPTIIEYTGVDLNLQYIPQSDDPFEPVFSSQLNVTIDITDDLTNMPNLVTLDDRKYFAKLYLGTDLEWTGWVLSDNVHVSYTTGRKQLFFNCTDGLGMLNDIPLPISNTTETNTTNTTLYFLLLSLNSLNLPTTPNVVTSCNFYGYGMIDRGTSSSAEPFIQSYLPYRTFIKEDYTYIDCLTVLKNILKSFGCRLFMASGKWWIVSINEFSKSTISCTEYTSSGSVASSTPLTRGSQIQGYTGNTSGLFFVNNSQFKLLKKGFNKIYYNKTVETSPNFFSNGNLRPLQPGSTVQPENWNASSTGLGSVSYINIPTDSSASMSLSRGGTGSATLQLRPVSGLIPAAGPLLGSSIKLKVSWTFLSQSLSAGDRCHIYLTITNGSSYYVWTGTTWSTTVGDYYAVPAYTGTSGSQINDYSFETNIVPIAGKIGFAISVEYATNDFVQVSNFKLEVIPLLKQINYNIYQNTTSQYAKEIEIPYGVYSASGTYPVELGVYLNSSGSTFPYWYEYGKTATYASLIELMMKQYMNVFGKNIINVDGALTSFETSNGYINASKSFTATDTDPTQINISTLSYMLGNSTIDYISDTTTATLLQISDTDITATNTYQIFYNNLI